MPKRKGIRGAAYRVPALEKGLDILEALAATPSPQTLADLARTLSRTSSELFRMVDTLEKRGYITRDGELEGYRLTLRLYELAHLHSPVEHLVRAAAGPMRALSDSVRESCHVAVLSHGMLMVVAEAESPDRVRLSVEIGSKVPPLRTVSGRLLASLLTEAEQEELMNADPLFARWSRARRSRFREELGKIRKARYTIAPSEYRTGIDLAVLVGNPEVGVAASVAIPCLAGGRNEGKERRLLAAMRRCAGHINDSLS